MSSFLLSLLGCAVLFGFFFSVFGGGACERPARFAAGVFLILVFLRPLSGETSFAFPPLPIPAVTDPAEIPLCDSTAAQAMERGVRDAVVSRFSFSADDVYVSAKDYSYSGGGGKVRVVLRGSAALSDSFAVERYLNEGGIDAEVVISFGT